MPSWAKEILDWLDQRLPGLMAAFGLGYRFGSQRQKELENELMDMKLDLEHREHVDEILKKYAGKLPIDVVRAAIASARNKPK